MGRPTKTVQVAECLIHYGHMDTWTDYGNGFGDDRDVSQVVANKMGKRPCRWLREGDWVCADLDKVDCELCLKSKAASTERKRIAKNQLRPAKSKMTAEQRIFWKRLDESVKNYRATTTPQERFQTYVYMERGRRIRQVCRIEKDEVTLT